MPQYNKYGEAMRNRVVKRFLQGEDWQVTARENGITFSTVRSWVKKQTFFVETRTRGGARRVKITDHKNFLEQRIN